MLSDRSPDGLDYSVYADDKLIAKFAMRNEACQWAYDLSGRNSAHIKVHQYDADYSPHLGRKIYL